MCNGNPDVSKKEWGMRNIFINNGQEFSKNNEQHQTIDTASPENTTHDIHHQWHSQKKPSHTLDTAYPNS